MIVNSTVEGSQASFLFVNDSPDDPQGSASDTETTSSGSDPADCWDNEPDQTSDDIWDTYWDYQYEPEYAGGGSDIPLLLAAVPQTPANTPETASFPPIIGHAAQLAVPIVDEDDEERLSFFDTSMRADVPGHLVQGDSEVTHRTMNILGRILVWLGEMPAAYLAHNDASTSSILRALCELLIAACVLIRSALTPEVESS
jgi:hypothetical protein